MIRKVSAVLLFFTTLVSMGCASIPGIAREDPSQFDLSEKEKAQLAQIRNGAQKPVPQAGQSNGMTGPTTTANDDSQPAVSEQTRLKVYLNLVQSMVDRNLFYAAIAHLDAMSEQDKKMPEAQLLRAEALRLTKQREAARGIYNALLSTALAGQAHRGLGLLAAEENKLDDAVTQLWQARWLRPTDPKVRNDLGYVLLLRGQTTQAREHLATALELSRGESLSAMNMVLLLFVEGQEEGAIRFGKSAQLDDASLASLRQRAVEVRQQISRRAFVTPPPATTVPAQTTGQVTANPPVPVASARAANTTSQAVVPPQAVSAPAAHTAGQVAVQPQAVSTPTTAKVASQVAPPPQAASVGSQAATSPQPIANAGGQAVTQPQSAPVVGSPTLPAPAANKVEQERLVKNSAGQVTSK